MMKRFLFCAMLGALLMGACSGEDRSGEEPFPPTVRMDTVFVEEDSLCLKGLVVSSPNSSVTACGFSLVGDTLNLTIEADTVAMRFEAHTACPAAGIYGAVAYATNGMGTTVSDTLYFEVP